MLRGATVSTAKASFDTNGTFRIELAGHLTIDGEPVDLGLTVARTAGAKLSFDGTVTIAGHRFQLDAATDPTATRLVATYDRAQGVAPIDLAKLLAAATSSPPDIDLTVDIKDATFALGTDANATHAVFGLDLIDINLSGLPLVDKALGDAAKVKELQVVAGDIALWNDVAGPKSTLVAQGDAPTVIVSGQMALGDTTMPLALPAAAPAATPSTIGKSTPAGTDSTKWFAVQRSFGPVTLARVGGRYDAGALWLLLDGPVARRPFVSLQGLGVGTPLRQVRPEASTWTGWASRSPRARSRSPAHSSSFRRAIGRSEFEYVGSAVVEAESFALSAVGSYAQLNRQAVALHLRHLDAPLGGPPALFVTGLIGGFGYNRSLKHPQRRTRCSSSRSSRATTRAPAPRASIDGVVDGRGWRGLGGRRRHFSSFDLVESRALLIAEFGMELQFALIGLSKMRLPQEGDGGVRVPRARAGGLLKPNERLLRPHRGPSPNSFVIDRACRLTGGFAFYSGSTATTPATSCITSAATTRPSCRRRTTRRSRGSASPGRSTTS